MNSLSQKLYMPIYKIYLSRLACKDKNFNNDIQE